MTKRQREIAAEVQAMRDELLPLDMETALVVSESVNANLLTALKALVDLLDRYENASEMGEAHVAAARAGIAKAEGA